MSESKLTADAGGFGEIQKLPLPDGARVLRGQTPIAGVKVIPLRRIPDERGTIFHMLRKTDAHFMDFGEIYFSSIVKDAVKGWHRHRDMTLHYACMSGRVKCVVYDCRKGSPTEGGLMEIFLGPDSYHLFVVPPETWNGFKGLVTESIVANACTHSHDPTRSDRLDPYVNEIPYDWARKDH
jgi:dTDP-4-dehydrorhamnose 3,5-epimerase